MLFLNACRSARAEPDASPRESTQDIDDTGRAWGSLAEEVVASGLPQVVAMRHSIYVATAAQYVGGFYDALACGETVARAVAAGRRSLYDEPLRSAGLEPRELHDWIVPIVFHGELGQLPLRAGPRDPATTSSAEEAPVSGVLLDLPPEPASGFVGRHQFLQAVDRAFDENNVVLVHGYAGSGKTTLSTEFARWYWRTAGVTGKVLFTSFEGCPSLPKVLGGIGNALAVPLRARGLDWHSVDDEERRTRLLDLMGVFEILWIWDSIESVAGFPHDGDSLLSDDEQKELVAFMLDAAKRGCRLLMTSRRPERRLLGDTPLRVPIGPMPWEERIELAAATAAVHGRNGVPGPWLPLLRFSQGNPLTIRLIVGFACREKITSEQDVGALLQNLRVGEADFEDEEEQGRSRSLGASLSYGFDRSFSEPERTVLSLLYLFQGVVAPRALLALGHADSPWAIKCVQGRTEQQLDELLSSATEIGLLSRIGPGMYHIMPPCPGSSDVSTCTATVRMPVPCSRSAGPTGGGPTHSAFCSSTVPTTPSHCSAGRRGTCFLP